MPYFDSFNQDWKKTKTEMEKIGGKKPAEIKKINLLLRTIEMRVSSGIGKALKAVDDAVPKDPNAPTEKELVTHRRAVVELLKAIKTEMALIESDIESYKEEGEEKVAKEAKNSKFRALKVFKAKLEHYTAAVSAQDIQYAQTRDKVRDDGEKQVKRFKVETKEQFARAVVGVKTTLATPTPQALAAAVKDARTAILNAASTSQMIDQWYESKRQTAVDMQSGAFYQLKQDFMNWRGAEATEAEAIRDTASALGKFLKRGLEALSYVKDTV